MCSLFCIQEKRTESLQAPISLSVGKESILPHISWVIIEGLVLRARESLCGAIRLELFLYEAEFNR